MKRVLFRVLLVLVLAGASLVAAAAPAQAARLDCPNGQRLCAWIHSNFTGPMYMWIPPFASCTFVGGSFGNAISSMWNNTAQYGLTFYNSTNCTNDGGGTLRLSPGQYVSSLGWQLNDKISSFTVHSYCTCLTGPFPRRGGE